MKYIVLEAETSKGGVQREIPFIFPDHLVHSEMVHGLKTALIAQGFKDNAKVISAGFYNQMTGSASGDSDSLGVASRGEEDSRLILMADYGVGIL